MIDDGNKSPATEAGSPIGRLHQLNLSHSPIRTSTEPSDFNGSQVSPDADRSSRSLSSCGVALQPLTCPIIPSSRGQANAISPQSCHTTHSVVTGLSALSQASQAVPRVTQNTLLPAHFHDDLLQPALDYIPSSTSASPRECLDDGIFKPGSSYLELHSTLRNRIFETARSAAPTRSPSPEAHVDERNFQRGNEQQNVHMHLTSSAQQDMTVTSTPNAAELTSQEGYELWKNWTDEVAPWVSNSFCLVSLIHLTQRSSTNSTINVISGGNFLLLQNIILIFDFQSWLFLLER